MSDDHWADDLEETPPEDESDAGTGEQAADAVRGGIWGASRAVGSGAVNFISSLTRPIPYLGARIWGGMAKRSLYYYYKASGGDRMGIEVFPSGKAKLQPVKYRPPEACEEDESPGWKAKGRDKTWKPTTDGQGGPRLHKTPIVPLSSEAWRATSVLEARVTEAVDQGEHRPLYKLDEATLEADVTVHASEELGDGGNAQATADGGYKTEWGDGTIVPRSTPVYEDEIIELNSDDHDGQAVSFRKVRDLWLEQTTTEEMSRQEERGFLAGRSNKNMMRWMFKIFLIAGLVAIAGLIGKELITALLGSGGGEGGGGGGMLPIMLNMADIATAAVV